MGIEAKFNMASLEDYLQQKKRQLENLIRKNLNYLGMKCVVLARTLNTYEDQTANLRNSIGYVVVINGKITDSFFGVEKRGSKFKSTDPKGEEVGEALAKKLAEEFTEGYTLIVVAGMNYAIYVEDVHHLDVLKPAETLAKNEINKVVEGIVASMRKKEGL